MTARHHAGHRRHARRLPKLGRTAPHGPRHRIRTWTGVCAVLFALVAAPLATALVSHAAYHSERARAQAADRHRVDAIVLEGGAHRGLGDGERPHGPVPARWTAPDGTPRRGAVEVTTAVRAGSTVRIWTDGRGDVTTAPPTPAHTRMTAATLGTAAGCAVLASVVVALWFRRRIREHRYDAELDAQWARLAPHWTRHYRDRAP